MRGLLRTFSILLKYSKGNSRGMVIVAAVASVVAGLASTSLIAVINIALSGETSSRGRIVLMFVALCVIVPASNFGAAFLLIRLTAQAAQDLRMQLSRAILAAPYRVLEELGVPRILATLTEDIPALTDAITDLPYLLSQFAIMTGCLAFLGWLSWPLLLAVVVYMVLGICLQQFPVRKAMPYWTGLREAWDVMFKAIRALTEGTKELKLNRMRREDFLLRQLDASAMEIRRNEIWGSGLSTLAGHGGQILFFIFIGLILFAAPLVMSMDRRVLTGYTLTILFMMTPLTVILNALPTIGRAQVSAGKIESLGLSLIHHPPESATVEPSNALAWNRLEFVDVTHTYRHEGAVDEFCLGPINLALHPGELVFIIGGNGSGKTTLAKVLVGLYEPEKGELRLDGTAIDLGNRDRYRQNFSVVFDDFYLFEDLFGIEKQMKEKGHEYLRRLQLDHKVQIQDDKLSTIDLSRGQRKRLALLTAYLEDRSIFVFDEWASDQDPMFKQLFYFQILPELKARGKTAVVITHDDRYYSVADRVIKLDRGQVESDQRLVGAGNMIADDMIKDAPVTLG